MECDGLVNVAWVVLHCNRHIGARDWRQLMPHVRFQVPFLGPESPLKSGFACAGLLCTSAVRRLRDGLVCGRIMGGSCSDRFRIANGVSPVFRAYAVDRIPLMICNCRIVPAM